MIHSGWKVPVLFSTASVNPLASVPWIAQWKFNNNGNDSIGANHLTNNNSATFTTGKLGGATGATQLVVASSQYWTVSDNANLSLGDVDFSIAAWVYIDSTSTFRMIASKSGAGNAGDVEFYLCYRGGVDRFRFLISSGVATTTVDANNFGSPSVATWYCVIAWHDATANIINISVNDSTETATSWSNGSHDTASPFSVGALGEGFGAFDGRIDNVCFAKSAAGGGGVLSAAQRTAFYNAGVGTETLT